MFIGTPANLVWPALFFMLHLCPSTHRGGAQDHAAAAEEGYLHAMAAGVLPAAAAAAAADRAQSPREGSPMAISPVPPEEDGAAAAAAAAT
jgi:hypothetical protein